MQTGATTRRFLVAVILLAGVFAGRIHGADTIHWRNIGPGGGGNIWITAVDPYNANIVLTGSDVGGIFRTRDGGLTWTIANDAAVQPDAGPDYGPGGGGVGGNFAFHPDPNSHTVYLGARKSVDDGRTWRINFPLSGSVTAIDPITPDVVYMANSYVVYRSACGWETSCSYTPGVLPDSNETIQDLVIDPNDHTHLLACGISGIYSSPDSGATWNTTSMTGLPYAACHRLAVHPSGALYMTLPTAPISPDSTGWIDLSSEPGSPSWKGGVYKNTGTGANWGQSWVAVNGLLGSTNLAPNGDFESPGDPTHPAASWSFLYGSESYVSRELTPSRSGSSTCPPTGTSSNAIKIDRRMAPPDLIQAGIATDFLPIDTSKDYLVSGWVKTDCSLGGAFFVAVEFFSDIGGTQPYKYASWNNEAFIMGLDNTLTDITKHAGWRYFERQIHPPDDPSDNSLYMQIQISSYIQGDHGVTWVDDIQFRETHRLPANGNREIPSPIDYRPIVVDSEDPNVLYVGTGSGTNNRPDGDTGGIYKSALVNGEINWTLVTRQHYRDNVLDGILTDPFCGNGLCEGRWENCNTCPDCGPPSTTCCGDVLNGHPYCQSPENTTTCPVDCPLFPDPTRPYFEVLEPYYGILGIGIGSGPLGHLTLHFGLEHYKSTDGGLTWTDMTSDLHVPTMGDPVNTWQGHGADNDVHTFMVVTDSRDSQRLYYGDSDGRLKVSYNAGVSFENAGRDWASGTTIVDADAATSIVLGDDKDTLYCGIGDSQAEIQGIGSHGGILKAVYDTAPPGGSVRPWKWSDLGCQQSPTCQPHLPLGGGIDLIRDPATSFYASVYGKGVFKLPANVNDSITPWADLTNGGTGTNWFTGNGASQAFPSGWKTYHIVRDPISGRLYVGAGNPGYCCSPPPADETGIWASDDSGATWRKISDSSTEMSQEPIVTLMPYDGKTLFAGTWYAHGSYTSINNLCTSQSWTGDGGLYKGTCADVNQDGLCDTPQVWTWTRVIAQPVANGIVKSPANGQILYASTGQPSGIPPIQNTGQCAGIWKSVDGGNTWVHLANDGLMNVGSVQLSFSANNNHILYGATLGDGVFEGTITCGSVIEGFPDSDGDGTRDCADANTDISGQVAVTEGSVYSGIFQNLRLSDNVYETLQEQISGNPRKLTKVWTFNNVVTGKPYELRVEGNKIGGSTADDFKFSYLTKASGGICSTNDTYPPGQTNILTVSKTTDDNQYQSVSLGTITNPVVCVRVQDSKRTGTDTQTDKLQLDQVVLFALPPCTDADGDGYAASCTSCTNAFCPVIDCNDALDTVSDGCVASTEYVPNPGSIVSPTNYTYTFASDDQRESLMEGLVNGKSQLIHTWKFTVPPGGATHTLHFEGNRTSGDGDDFQFWFSTSAGSPPANNTFVSLNGAVINTSTDTPHDVTFLPNFSGVVHIQIRDTKQNSGSVLDTVNVDHLIIKTSQ